MLWVAAAAGLTGAAVGAAVVLSARRRDARKMDAIARRLGTGVRQAGGAVELERAAMAVLGRLAQAGDEAALLRGALEDLAEAVVVADPGGAIMFRNRFAAELSDERPSGTLLSEAIGVALEEARDGEVVDREISFYGPPPRELHLRARPVRAGEAGSGAVAVIEDISGSRRVDSVRRDFVANVSHELRTPIGAIALLGETILDTRDADVTERLAGRVVQEAERLGRIVGDLLDLSAIEAGVAPIRRAVQVSKIVAEAADRVRDFAGAAGIPLTVSGPFPDVAVAGDRQQLVGALVNLLENALKYSERGSRVGLSAREDGCQVVLTVTDQGIGIPTEHIERIFERFYRVDRARSRDSGGTGLGLSIVRRVARAHGGDATVESQEGEGSTFCLSLPVLDPEQHDSARHPESDEVREAAGDEDLRGGT